MLFNRSHLYKYRITAIFLPILLLFLTACGEQQPEHTHKWEAANCTRGELCWSCSETRGEPLAHAWTDATCTAAKHCSRCGLTEGSSLGHITQGSFCTRCNETLNTMAKMNEYSESLPLVYGGVEVVYSLYGGLNGYPQKFEIYNQDGVKIASRCWPHKIPCLTGEKNEEGRWLQTLYANTEFVPLEPGSYQLEFYYYERRTTSSELSLDEYIYPAGDIATKSFTLTVR